MIVLDASVLIAVLDADDPHHHRGIELLRGAASTPLSASVMTLAETLVGPSRSGIGEMARAAIDGLGVAAVPLMDDDAVSLAALRAMTGMRMPDCCVLLACSQTGGALATFDTKLATAAKTVGTALIN